MVDRFGYCRYSLSLSALGGKLRTIETCGLSLSLLPCKKGNSSDPLALQITQAAGTEDDNLNYTRHTRSKFYQLLWSGKLYISGDRKQKKKQQVKL